MNATALRKTILFQGMSEEEVSACLKALRVQEKEFEKNTMILRAGDMTDQMGLVLSGSVTIESNDLWGNVTVLSHVGAGQFFAETYAMLPDEVLLVDARANEDCRILFMNIGGIIKPADRTWKDSEDIAKNGDGALEAVATSSWKGKMLQNLLQITARKNLILSGRSFHTSPKSARARLLSYLNAMSIQKDSDEFDIPFNRQQLADYLNLERTNMSKELGRMQREGMIEFRKNHFRLYLPIE